MDRQAAIQELRQKALDIGAMVTSMHPRVPGLNDAAAQGEILKALFELTKQVEVVKKHLLKLEKRDDSAAL
jgi:hypothetical protein